MQNYRRLSVWRKAHAIAQNVHRLPEDIPRGGNTGLISQLRRAALSIPANIAEGSSPPREFTLRQHEVIEIRKMLTGLVKHLRQTDSVKRPLSGS
jgi:hypothetical protein